MRKNANLGDVKFYTLLAIVLGIITFFEFAFVEWQGLLFNNDGLILWSLYILSIVKFFLVVMFFMHLWGDHKLLTQLFTAGMVIGSITVAIMLMLFTANNMNRYRVEQPVSISSAHGGGHGGEHGDETHIEIPIRDFAETLARPAPKSQQYALAPRESIDAGSLNLPTISLPTIDQGVQPAGSLELQPEVVETTVVTEAPQVVEPQVVEQVTQVVETVMTEATTAMPATTDTSMSTMTTAAATEAVTTTTTTEVVSEAAESNDLATLRAQVEALRLELEAMESELPAEGTAATSTIQAVTTAPATTMNETMTETVTTTVTQAAPVAAAVAATTTAVTSAVSSATNATESATETISASAATTEAVVTETAAVSFDSELGNATYMNCLACHQITGEGIPGAFPPLKGHMPKLYNADGGREYLIQVVLYGLQGQIVVDGMTYNGLMTPWNSLSDDAIAAVLNHELTSWGNDAMLNNFSPITAEEVATQRATPLTAMEVLANRVIE